MVDATEAAFSAGNRQAAALLYAYLGESGGGSSAAIGFFTHSFFDNRYFPDHYFQGTGGEETEAITACAHVMDVALYSAGLTDVALYQAISSDIVC